MHYKLLIFENVYKEIEQAVLYYNSISKTLALRFAKEVQAAINRLKRNPFGYFNLEDNKHRRIKINGLPYAFAYLVKEENIIVKILSSQLSDPALLQNL